MSKYVGTKKIGEHLVFDDDSAFGNSNIAGLQLKGIAEIDNQDRFVKLDDLALKGRSWKPQFDYQYSSVSDAIISCLARNIKNSDLNSVDYKFAAFERPSGLATGTVSDIYLKEHEVERLLSSGNKTDNHVAVKIDDYANQVVDSKFETRLHNLTEMFAKNGVPEQTAHDFLIQQAGFDVLTGNNDRLNNPSNFVIAFDQTTRTGRPINMDYGRCLQISTWAQTMNDNLQIGDEYYQEDLQGFADDFRNNDSIVKSYSVEDSLQQLKEQGFQPLLIDKQGLDNDLYDLAEKIKAAHVPCEKFALVKIDAFKVSLESDQMQGFWETTTPELSFDGLTDESPVNYSDING